METIRLEQHFYGSAPVGLSSSRGFQTIAKSALLTDVAPLEKHCSYSRPEGRREGRMPVNWGWFPLEDGRRACIHRIGYAGTDEFGRPGNFLAHNLIVSDEGLRAIDYDITSLIRWVRDHSLKYSHKDAKPDGFAQRNAEIFEQFGKEKAGLAEVPPLEPRTEAIRAIRKAADEALLTETLGRLSAALDAERIRALLRAYLGAMQERKPLWIAGLSDGCQDCELELVLAELWFGLLPYHCRRQFTFSTYTLLGQSAGSARPADAAPHVIRRMAMTVPGTTRLVPGGQAYLVDLATGQHLLPEKECPAAEKLLSCLNKEGLASLLEVRNLVSHFEFPEDAELQGFSNAWPLQTLVGKPAPGSPADLRLYHYVCRRLRPERRGMVRLIETAHRLVDRCDSLEAPALEQLAADYLATAVVQFPAVASMLADASGHWPAVTGRMAKLLLAGWQRSAWKAVEEVLHGLAGSGELQPLRKEGLAGILEVVKRNVLVADPRRLGAFWAAVDRSCSAEDQEVGRFLAEVATHLCEIVLKGMANADVAAQTDDQILPILSSARIERPEQLRVRLELVNRVCGQLSFEKARQLSKEFLANLVRRGNLGNDVLEEILSRRIDLLLRFHEAWLEAARRLPEHAETIQARLRDPALLTTYWTNPSKTFDRSWETGAQSALEGIRGDLSGRPTEERLAAIDERLVWPYCRTGSQQLALRLAEWSSAFGGQLADVFHTHCRLIDLVLERLLKMDRDKSNSAAIAVWAHLRELLAAVCRHCSHAEGGANELWREPLEVLTRAWRDVEVRTRFFAELAGDLWRRCRAGSASISAQNVPVLLHQALTSCGLGTEEARWYCLWIQGALMPTWPMPVLQDHRQVLLADLVVEYPELLTTPDQDQEFRVYVNRNFAEAAWQRVLSRLIEEFGPQTVDSDSVLQKIDAWFRPGAPLRRLLEIRDGLLETGASQVIDRINECPMSAFRAWDGSLRAWDAMLQCRMPPGAEGKIKQLLFNSMASLCSEVAQERRESNSIYVTDQWYERVCRVTKPLAHVAGELDRNDLTVIWKLLGQCLCRLLDENRLRGYVPAIFRIGQTLEFYRVHTRNEVEVWHDLFWFAAIDQLEHNAGNKRLLRSYLIAGETLCAGDSSDGSLADRVKAFMRLPRFKEWFIHTEPSHWWKRGVREDLLEQALSELPRTLASHDSADRKKFVAARARFAGYLYAPGISLARIYSAFGVEPGGPQEVGLALAAYVTRNGTYGKAVTEEVKRLCQSKNFWKELRRAKNKAASICETVDTVLKEWAIKPQQSADIAAQLRKQFGSRLRFW